MTSTIKNPRLFGLSKILLCLLIVSINIREPFFHTREVLFILVVLTSLDYIDAKKLKFSIALVTIWLISATYNILIPGSDFSLNMSGLNTIIISGYLALICFSQDRYADTVIKSYIFVAVLVASITIIVWLLCYRSESSYLTLRYYFTQLQNRTGLSLISIDYRTILGRRFLTAWYRTSPCMICALGYCLGERLRGAQKRTIVILLLGIALVFSGTRANMLSAILLMILYIAYWFSKKRFLLTKALLLSIAIIGAFAVGLKFLNDHNSASSMIKVSDATTYIRIYKSDVLRTLFFGWGPGSTFYSVGRGLVVDATELTLFETIRRYGLISTLVVFFYIWFKPLYSILSKEQLKHKSFYVATLFAFIVTACTNPYLLDSVGFCALLFYCTYFDYGIGEEYFISDQSRGKQGFNYA